MVEEAKEGMCIQLEYYHVIDYVITIYKSPALIDSNKPLIMTEGDLETAAAEAYWLLYYYLGMSENEKKETDLLTAEVVRKKHDEK